MGINVLSLFDGISCGQIALERAGIEVDNYYASEIDYDAISVTMNNYPNTIQLGDVMNIDFKKIDNIDILIGGSPCNHWTIAKANRETTCDGIGFKLFLQYVKALKETKPKYFLYENNFAIHRNIKDKITECLGVEPIMINSSLVSAQNRKRYYWTNIPNIVNPHDKNIKLSDVINQECYCVTEQPFKRKKINGKYDRRYEPRKDFKSGTVVGTREGQLNMVAIKSNKLYSNCKVEKGIFYGKDKSYPISIPDGHYIVRSFNIHEREQLQTLPIGYTGCIKECKSKKVIGNGWTVDVIAHILKGIKDELI